MVPSIFLPSHTKMTCMYTHRGRPMHISTCFRETLPFGTSRIKSMFTFSPPIEPRPITISFVSISKHVFCPRNTANTPGLKPAARQREGRGEELGSKMKENGKVANSGSRLICMHGMTAPKRHIASHLQQPAHIHSQPVPTCSPIWQGRSPQPQSPVLLSCQPMPTLVM